MTARAFASGRLLVTLLALFVVLPAAGAERGTVHHLAVPARSVAPFIDGVMAPGEWDSATAVTGFRTTYGKLLPLQPVVRIGYDMTNLYICIRGPRLLPRAAPPGRSRRPG